MQDLETRILKVEILTWAVRDAAEDADVSVTVSHIYLSHLHNLHQMENLSSAMWRCFRLQPAKNYVSILNLQYISESIVYLQRTYM